MTIASDLLQRHFQTLVQDNSLWQTLIADDLVWELLFGEGQVTMDLGRGPPSVARPMFPSLGSRKARRLAIAVGLS